MKNLKQTVESINLDEYRKDACEKLDPYTTSVTMDKRHKAFLDREKLNLSKLVRDMLDQLEDSPKARNKK